MSEKNYILKTVEEAIDKNKSMIVAVVTEQHDKTRCSCGDPQCGGNAVLEVQSLDVSPEIVAHIVFSLMDRYPESKALVALMLEGAIKAGNKITAEKLN